MSLSASDYRPRERWTKAERAELLVQVSCDRPGCGVVMERMPDQLSDFNYCSHECKHADRVIVDGVERPRWFRARGSTVSAPCDCVLPDGSTCGRLTRVRVGREYQIDQELVVCARCRRKGRRRPRSQRARERQGELMGQRFGDPRWRGRWYFGRYKSTAEFGRLSTALAEGTVGRPRGTIKISAEAQERIRAEAAKGATLGEIAARTGVAKSTLHRFLAAEKASH